MGHKASMLLDSYGHVIADLGRGDRKPAGEVIEAARRDIPMT